MSVLIGRDTRLVIQGVTGRRGRRMVEDLEHFGASAVAGVSPGHGGETLSGCPVFDFVSDAVHETGANTSVILVPGLPNGSDAVREAEAAGIAVAVWVADPVPVSDVLMLKSLLRGSSTTLVGPNTPGIISPGRAKAGFMPTHCYTEGPVGVVSRSGSLSYEVSLRLTSQGLGQSTVIGVGGDPITGLTMLDAVGMLDRDAETTVILVLGEVGGVEEYEVAACVRDGSITTPVVAYLVGESAPAGRKLGHAGAIVFSDRETVRAKRAALEASGISVATRLAEIAPAVNAALNSGQHGGM
ncbi:MAG: succinate--CoA ligase subunit alpha [Candidatus Dormibacteraeota bacterium]|nr:succinate--CoA ligase subunit alpha [Candidatus Dormibacteraeota bacterium]